MSQRLGKQGAILEGRVHPLPQERHHGMGGVAQQDRVADVPGRAADRHQRPGRVGEVVALQVWQQGHGVRELAQEEGADVAAPSSGRRTSR